MVQNGRERNLTVLVDRIKILDFETSTQLHSALDKAFVGRAPYLNRYYKGKIDEVKIWNVALDSSQVLMSSSLVRLDTNIPTIPSVTLSSSNNSQNLAKPEDNLTLDFTVSEDIPQPTVNLAGHAVIPSNSSGDGKTWQAVYRVDNTTLNENVSFNIGFSDAAGNVGDNVTTVTSGTPILVDTEPPFLSQVKIRSNNDNSTLAKAEEVITLSFSSSESIDRPSVTLGLSLIHI